jgi:hypothetical protein
MSIFRKRKAIPAQLVDTKMLLGPADPTMLRIFDKKNEIIRIAVSLLAVN